jgi:large subunit ribosomal protein L10
MAITKDKKAEIISKVEDIAKSAKTLVFASFKGLDVAAQNEMRKAFRATDVGYTVAKKTLLKRGLEGKYEGAMPELLGEIGLAYGSDELAPAREMMTFIKKYPEQLAFVGGVFEGKFVSKDEITSIAAIPGMETLRAMFAQVINSPRQRFAVVLSEVAKKLPAGAAPAAPAPAEEVSAPAEAPAPVESAEAPAEVTEPTADESSEQTTN